MQGKLLKAFIVVVLLLAGLMVVAVIVLPLIIDPNDYKDEIATAVREQTGRTLAIEGDISLSVFPWLGLDIGPTRFSNAEGFADPDMASMEAWKAWRSAASRWSMPGWSGMTAPRIPGTKSMTYPLPPG